MNLVGISQPGVVAKAESPPSPPALRLSVLRAAGHEPWPWARKRAWAGHTHPWHCDAQTAGVKLPSPEPAWTWPFAELDAPNLSLGAEQAAICRVAPGPRHLARLLIKGKINDPSLVVPLPVLGSG